MSRFEKILFSTRTMAVLLLLYAISMAVATFVENDYDTPTAKALVYNSKWFELIMLWLIIIFIANIGTYRLMKREKWPILVFHLAFIFMFIGGGITRYYSFEGQMPIEIGETTNQIISDETYIKLHISDGVNELIYDRDPYMMSYFNAKNTRWPLKRTYKQEFQFGDKIVTVKSLDYIPMAKDSIQIDNNTGKNILNIVTMGQGGRVNNYITDGEVKSIDGSLFSFNNPLEGSIQLSENENGLIINSPVDAGYISMQGQQKGVITDTALLAQQAGEIKKGVPTSLKFRSLYTINNTAFIIANPAIKGKVVVYRGDKSNTQDKNLMSAVQLEVGSGNEKDTIMIKGGRSVTGFSKSVIINGMQVALGFGSKVIRTPFSLRCDKFIVDRYPGSKNPSSYESFITVIDNGQEDQHHIYMNNVMDYKGYRFFQASYFPDESGTILSVNKDWWGTNITYIGYFLLFSGMFLTLFWKGTHLWKLNQQLKSIHKRSLTLIPLLVFFLNGFSQNTTTGEPHTHHHEDVQPSAQFAQLDELGNPLIDLNHAKKFGNILVQDFQGRIKPMDTHTLDMLRKIYKKDKYKDFTPDQWFLSMQIDPAYWISQPLIYVGKKGGEELAKETAANAENYTSFMNLVDQNTGVYKLEKQYNTSFSKRKADQSNYDKEIIEVTERFNIFNNIVYGYYTKIIPVKGDPSNTWRSWIYSTEENPSTIDSVAYTIMEIYFGNLKDAIKSGNYNQANSDLEQINLLQRDWGKEVVPPMAKVKLEVFYNHANFFFWLMIAYSLLGISMVALGFADVLSGNAKTKNYIQTVTKILLGLMIIALFVQIVALGIRWYLSGHAPWSSGYEAIVFISAIGVLAGLILYKNRNAFIPAAGALVAMIMMGFAHGGSLLDPQITPLEPVLKSYWLMVHVGIITSSYGFFGLSAVISIISLIMFCLKPTSQLKSSIQELTIVNEMAVEIGVFALTIGTFLGGMWANESWGRYWSWDPKETWAFISVIFYATVLHFRIVPGLRGYWKFNVGSMWMIWTIIFTYFGVNYYLSGLHSYAAGDPMPIPIWIPITATAMVILTIISYIRHKNYNK